MASAFLKFLILAFLILTYVMSAGSIRLLRRDHREKRRALARLTRFYTRQCIRLFKVKIHVKGLEHLQQGGRAPLIISNHLSYLDVFLLSSIHPAIFVTSVEVRDSPFLGLMSKSGGSVFVERRSKWGLSREIEEINEVLASGIPVVIFAEGTTSNGDGVLPFKSALLSCAGSVGTEIVPACIRYIRLNGAYVDRGNRDRLYYYDDIRFFPHFMGLMSVNSIEVELSFLPPLAADQARGQRRKELAERIRERILKIYLPKPITPSPGEVCQSIQEQTVLS